MVDILRLMGLRYLSIPVCCMDAVHLWAFELDLIISPYSSIVFEELTFEELGEKEYLDETCEGKKDVLIITPDYPSYINLYLCAFVHSRNMEYKRHGLEFQVVTISPNNWFESLTDFRGISVLCGNAGLLKRILRKRRHKCIIVHFVDNTIFRILDEYTDDVDQMIFICHGPETLYRYLVILQNPLIMLRQKNLACLTDI